MHWIIGDIHGMYASLASLLEAIDKHDSAAQLIFCGDYVNRGADSFRVIELLLGLKNARFCRGNHDDLIDLLLSGSCFVHHPDVNDVVTSFKHFMQYGLDQTLLSYGIGDDKLASVARRPTLKNICALLEPIPESHRDFFKALPVLQFEANFFVAHAKWDVDQLCGVPSFPLQITHSAKLRHDLIWGRFTQEEIDGRKRWDRPGFFGHTPVTVYRRSEPILPVRGNLVTLLDTAAAVHPHGRLTGWCVEEATFLQTDREGSIVHGATAQ